MREIDRSRRAFLKSAAVCTVAVAGGLRSSIGVRAAQCAIFIGNGAPKTSVPPNACDSHIHIFSTRFPASPHWKGEPVVRQLTSLPIGCSRSGSGPAASLS